jgi:pilus assembly protein FimV
MQLAPEHPLFKPEETIETESVSVESVESEQTLEDTADDSLEFNSETEADNVSIAVDLSEDDTDNAPLEFSTVNLAPEAVEQDDITANQDPSDEMPTEQVDDESVEQIDDDLLSFDSGTTFGKNEEEDETEVEHDSLLPFEPGASSSLDPDRIDIAPFDSELNDEADIEFDIGDIDEIDEAETKLDLASAYIDMDDPEGATSILKEVIAEGNDEQKVRAQTILDSLSD